jgi:hypothetical protein
VQAALVNVFEASGRKGFVNTLAGHSFWYLLQSCYRVAMKLYLSVKSCERSHQAWLHGLFARRVRALGKYCKTTKTMSNGLTNVIPKELDPDKRQAQHQGHSRREAGGGDAMAQEGD